MRIGIIAGEYPPMQGGVGDFTAILAHHLHEQGHELFLLSTTAAQSDDLPLTNLQGSWGLRSLWNARQWAIVNKLDLINLQFQTAAYQMSPWIHFLADYLRPLPFVTTFHDLRAPYLFPKAGPLRPWIVMHLARRSTGVIVTNHEDASRLQHLNECVLIPIGSNILDPLPDDFNGLTWRKGFGAAENDFLLAYFGLVNRSKGLDILLQSLADLRANGVPARLIIIGGVSGSSDPSNAAYLREIEGFIQLQGLAAFVHRTGYLMDENAVASYLRASDAVVLPYLDGASFRRGSLMAAIHYACLIVTTQPGISIPDFVDGQNMLLIPPGDSTALTAALLQLYESPLDYQHLPQAAQSLARRFAWEQIAADTLAFFQKQIDL